MWLLKLNSITSDKIGAPHHSGNNSAFGSQVLKATWKLSTDRDIPNVLVWCSYVGTKICSPKHPAKWGFLIFKIAFWCPSFTKDDHWWDLDLAVVLNLYTRGGGWVYTFWMPKSSTGYLGGGAQAEMGEVIPYVVHMEEPESTAGETEAVVSLMWELTRRSGTRRPVDGRPYCTGWTGWPGSEPSAWSELALDSCPGATAPIHCGFIDGQNGHSVGGGGGR